MPIETPEQLLRRRRLYDASALLYDVTFSFIWRFGFPWLEGWLRRQFANSFQILDAGCGPGYWTRALARDTDRRVVVGLDFSHKALLLARRRLTALPARLVEADLRRVPFGDKNFDGILCSGVLDTFPDPAPAFLEFHRLLSSGGMLVLILRGHQRFVSVINETIFRVSVGLADAFKSRSLRRLYVPQTLWSRRRLRDRLGDLAAETGFRLILLDDGWLATRAILVRDEQAAPSKEQQSIGL